MLEKKMHTLVPTHENKTNMQKTGQQRPEAAAPAALRRNIRVLGTMSPFYSAGIPNPEERFMQIPTQMQPQEQDCSQQ